MLLFITQRDEYKVGSETLKPSNVSQRMGFRMSLDTQDWVKYWFLEPNKNGFCTTKAFQLLPMMGFKVSVDTKDWKKYWFQEPNNVSMTIKPYCVFPNKLGSKLSTEHAQNNVLADLMLKCPILFISLIKNTDFVSS